MERAIDTAEGGDDPARGKSVGLRFDEAWYVSDLQPTDAVDGTAAVDVRTLARPQEVVTPVPFSGVDPGGGSQAPSIYDGQRWEVAPPTEPLRNAFDATLSGTSAVTLDLRRMGLTVRRPLEGTVETEDAVRLVLRLPERSCAFDLAPGSHEVELRPSSC
jgi:hypothetical protein